MAWSTGQRRRAAGTSRGTVALLTTWTLMVTGWLVVLGSPAAAVPPLTPAMSTIEAPCADMAVIGVRGSGEPTDMGGPGGSVASAVAQAVGMSRSVRYVPVDYTAAATDVLAEDLARNLNPATADGRWAYFDSIDDGIARLSAALDRAAVSCPTEKLIVVGYSQGALAVRQVMSSGYGDPQRVAGVILVADPGRRSSDADTMQTEGTAAAGNGVWQFAGLTAPSYPVTLAPVTWSVCNSTDAVCDTGNLVAALTAGATPASGLEVHSQSYLAPAGTAMSASWAAGRAMHLSTPRSVRLDVCGTQTPVTRELARVLGYPHQRWQIDPGYRPPGAVSWTSTSFVLSPDRAFILNEAEAVIQLPVGVWTIPLLVDAVNGAGTPVPQLSQLTVTVQIAVADGQCRGSILGRASPIWPESSEMAGFDGVMPSPTGVTASLVRRIESASGGPDEDQVLASTTLSATGQYSFGNLADGEYLVKFADGPGGFLDRWSTGYDRAVAYRSASNPVVIAGGPVDLADALQPSLRSYGVVTDATGKGIKGITVTLNPSITATTGTGLLDGVMVDGYWSADEVLPAEAYGSSGDCTDAIWYSGKRSVVPAAAGPFALGRVDYRYQAPVTFLGTVVDTAGKPYAGARVTFDYRPDAWLECWWADNHQSGTAVTDADGQFTFIGPPGTGVIGVQDAFAQLETSSSPVRVDAGVVSISTVIVQRSTAAFVTAVDRAGTGVPSPFECRPLDPALPSQQSVPDNYLGYNGGACTGLVAGDYEIYFPASGSWNEIVDVDHAVSTSWQPRTYAAAAPGYLLNADGSRVVLHISAQDVTEARRFQITGRVDRVDLPTFDLPADQWSVEVGQSVRLTTTASSANGALVDYQKSTDGGAHWAVLPDAERIGSRRDANGSPANSCRNVADEAPEPIWGEGISVCTGDLTSSTPVTWLYRPVATNGAGTSYGPVSTVRFVNTHVAPLIEGLPAHLQTTVGGSNVGPDPRLSADDPNQWASWQWQLSRDNSSWQNWGGDTGRLEYDHSTLGPSYYRVQATNSYGTTTSTVMRVDVLPGTLGFDLVPTPATSDRWETPAVGDSLAVELYHWGYAVVTCGHQWRRSGQPIPGATSLEYRVVAADVGSVLSLAVTCSHPLYLTRTVTSTATGPVSAAAPVGAATGVLGDATGDRVADVFGVDADGTVQFYAGSPTGPLAHQGQRGTSLAPMTYLAQVKDLNGDNRSDLIARDGAGNLFTFASSGNGHLTGQRQIGRGWSGMDQIIPVGNIGGGTAQYIIARRKSDGTLWRYGFTTTGLTNGVPIGANWGRMRVFIGVGDKYNDSRADLLAIRTDGTLWAYSGTPQATLGMGTQVGRNWGAMVTAFSPGDMNKDARPDLIGRRTDGTLWEYDNLPTGSWSAARQIGTGFSGYRLLA